MKNSAIILFINIITFYRIHAQTYMPNYGKIEKSELEMISYEKDTTTGAIILYDIGHSYFYENLTNYSIRFTRKMRIKILKKDGFDAGSFEVYLYQEHSKNKEELTFVEGKTYNLQNGNVVSRSLDKLKVYEEQINNNLFKKKFIMPEIKEGSVIEITYTIESPFVFNLPDWTFQREYPTVYSEYTTSMIPYYEYVFILKGADKFHYQKSYEEKSHTITSQLGEGINVYTGRKNTIKIISHTYVMIDIPAFIDEGFIYNRKDHLISLDFQLATIYQHSGSSTKVINTWDNLIKDLFKSDYFGKFIDNSEKIAQKILEEELILTGKSDKEKIKEILHYVKNN